MSSKHVLQPLVFVEARSYQLAEIADAVGLDEQSVLELLNCEVIAMRVTHENSYVMTDASYLEFQRASRLKRDFELAPEGLALAVRLLRRIDELERFFARISREN